MYICYLAMLPLLRALVRGIGRERMRAAALYVCGLCAVFGLALGFVLPKVLGVGVSGHLSLPLLSSAVVYPLMGYLLANISLGRKGAAVLLALALASVCASCAATLQAMGQDPASEQGLGGYAAFFPALAVFCGMRSLFARVRMPERALDALVVVSSCTFGVYLLEETMRQLMLSRLVGAMCSVGLPMMLAAFLGCLVILFVGVLATLVLKRVPLLRRLL